MNDAGAAHIQRARRSRSTFHNLALCNVRWSGRSAHAEDGRAEHTAISAPGERVFTTRCAEVEIREKKRR